MGLAKIYQCTKFEVSSSTRSRFTEGGSKFKGVQNLKNGQDPDYTQFGGILSSWQDLSVNQIWRF